MSALRFRRRLVLALVAALLLAPATSGAEREPDRGPPAETGFESGDLPFLPAVAPERGERRTPGRADEGRRLELPAPAGLRAPRPEAAPELERVAGASPCARALERWCLSHSTSTASP